MSDLGSLWSPTAHRTTLVSCRLLTDYPFVTVNIICKGSGC